MESRVSMNDTSHNAKVDNFIQQVEGAMKRHQKTSVEWELLLYKILFIKRCEIMEFEAPRPAPHENSRKIQVDFVSTFNSTCKYYCNKYNGLFPDKYCEYDDSHSDFIFELLTIISEQNAKIILDRDLMGYFHEQHLSDAIRRGKGIYYTPRAVARAMARKAFTLLPSVNNRGPNEASIRILDPACGSGVFLEECFNLIKEMQGRGSNAIHAIHGIDKDIVAVTIARVNLFFNGGCTIESIPVILRNIVHGNFIHQTKPSIELHNEFDIIIGNPPYVPWKDIDPDDRTALEGGKFAGCTYRCRPRHGDAQPNYYLFFLLKSLGLFKSGVMSFIMPQEWFVHDMAFQFRDFIAGEADCMEAFTFPDHSRVFNTQAGDVGTTSMIFYLIKRNGQEPISGGRRLSSNGGNESRGRTKTPVVKTIEYRRITDLRTLDSSLIARAHIKDLRGQSWVAVPEEFMEIRAGVEEINGIPLGNSLYFEVKGGFQPPVKKARIFEIDATIHASLLPREKEHCFKCIQDASEIQRFSLKPKSERYWIILNEIDDESLLEEDFPNLHSILARRILEREGKWWHFPNVRNFNLIKKSREKILSPRTSKRPRFALDLERCVIKGTNAMIVSKKMPTRYVLGILNSSLSEFWFDAFGYNYHGGKVRKYEPAKIKKHAIPIAKGDGERVSAIIKIVDEIYAHSSKGRKTLEKLEARLNELVFDLYQIPPKTIRDIGRHLKKE
ncbi:MAG: Eco57I restriction-modification methylase domain-containing protein [Promethearchaeota archaeon]